MPLPDLIEIVPLTQPVRADITVPGSKSITNRALVLAALADGETTLQGALWSEDTQVMVDCLQELGFMVNVEQDANESCNRTITVYGQGGQVPRGGSEAQPLELFVGNAGTAARFLAAMVCLGEGVYRLHGVPRMHERPQSALFQALRQLGFRVESEQGNDKLPVRIWGGRSSSFARSAGNLSPKYQELLTGDKMPSCKVSISESSQFASALLLCAKVGCWKIELIGENADESPYVMMTSKLIEAFSNHGGTFQIEPDASSGSYFWAAGKWVDAAERMEYSEQFGVEVATQDLTPISVKCWPATGWQIDARFPDVLFESFALHLGLGRHHSSRQMPADPRLVRTLESPSISRQNDLGDSIMTAVVLAPFSLKPVFFTDLGRLRVQECERVVALRTELTKCGAKVIETGDTLEVFPSALHGAEIETYNDHRMAMCFAILGLKIPGIKIKNPACVKKTFPNFFQKLAAAPPHGLGATILDASGRPLTHDELFAD